MATNHSMHIVLSALGLLLLSACAAQPASRISLDEKYFQKEVNNYQKFEHEGQTVYCQRIRNTASLIPYNYCITEAALRQRVADYRRDRNAVQRGGPQYVATVPGGSGT